MAAAYVRNHIADLGPAQICQLFYVLSAGAVLAIAAAPEIAQQLLMQYGARSSAYPSASALSQNGAKDSGRDTTDGICNGSLLSRFLDRLTSMGRVPHSWFIHFYIVSVLCSGFWTIQFVTHGTVLELILRNQVLVSTSSMTMGQVSLVSFLMGLQGARRLYEHLFVLRPSSSNMWFVHWLLGIGFYLCTSVSVWVEGSRSIINFGGKLVDFELPGFKSIIGGMHLADLKKYSLPEKGLFRYLVCPHYTCECLLYLSMAVIAAPQGQLYNQTLACATLFVTINLGATANGTKQWYTKQFGSRVQRKWKMIPAVF
ncbi:hypothetical protein F4861DRAFT_534719 [Xylaria intraflava]|nr:hypothetical protein F4861DRAFT_534719 [Xylaria intraflava]